jgi:hypothetical protein
MIGSMNGFERYKLTRFPCTLRGYAIAHDVQKFALYVCESTLSSLDAAAMEMEARLQML